MIRNRRLGVSTIEFSLMLCLISMAAIWSVSSLGSSIKSPFATVSATLNQNSAKNTTDVATSEPQTNVIALVILVSIGIAAVGLFLLKSPRKNDNQNGAAKRAIVDQLHAMLGDIEKTDQNSGKNGRKRDDILRALILNAACHEQTCLTANEIMTSGVCYVSPETKASRVRREMKSGGLRHVIVCDATGLKGVVSDRDLSKVNARTASQLMTRNPISIGKDHDVAEAIELILLNRISCLPVVEDKKVVGVVTVTDISVTLQCILGLFGKILWCGGQE